MKMAASRARGEPRSNVVLPDSARCTARCSSTRSAASGPLTGCSLEAATATVGRGGTPFELVRLEDLLVGAGFLRGGAGGFLALIFAEAARDLACDLPVVFEDFAILFAVARTRAQPTRPRWLADLGTKEQWTREQ